MEALEGPTTTLLICKVRLAILVAQILAAENQQVCQTLSQEEGSIVVAMGLLNLGLLDLGGQIMVPED